MAAIPNSSGRSHEWIVGPAVSRPIFGFVDHDRQRREVAGMKASLGTTTSRTGEGRSSAPTIGAKEPVKSNAIAMPAATDTAAKSTSSHRPTGVALATRSASTVKKADLMTDSTDQDIDTADTVPGSGQDAGNDGANDGGDPSTTDEVAAESGSAPARGMTTGDRRPMHGGPVTISRAAAKDEIFAEGDHVVYPTHGVGKVERIATEEIAGHRLELIHITFEENRMTLRVPVAKARSAGLRKLATRDMFDEALKVLRGKARIKRTMWSRRAQEYEAKINSGDPLAIAEVVRDLHRNAGQPDQSFSERQIYEAAMDRLAAELAALDKTDKATAAIKLADFLKTV